MFEDNTSERIDGVIHTARREFLYAVVWVEKMDQ